MMKRSGEQLLNSHLPLKSQKVGLPAILSAIESRAIPSRYAAEALSNFELREANTTTTPIEGGIGRGAGAESGVAAGGGRDLSGNGGAGAQLVTDAAAVVSVTNATVDRRNGVGEENHPNQDRIKTRIGEQLYKRPGLALSTDRQRALQSIFVVCDGHGSQGGPAATYFSSRLLDDLESGFFEFEQQHGGDISIDVFTRDAPGIISKVFVTADDEYREEIQRKGWNPAAHDAHSGGASATVIVVFQRFIALANAGDSRAILMARSVDLKEPTRTGTGTALEVVKATKDHSLYFTEETTRAVENGGEIARGGAYIRVGNHMLNMTRSLGDYDFKQDPDSPVVSSLPHVRMVDACQILSLAPSSPTPSSNVKYLYLVAASDGLWDFILPEEEVNRLETSLGEGGLGPAENEAVCKIVSQFVASDGSLDPVPPTKALRDIVHRGSHGHSHGRGLYYDDFSVLVTSLAFYP
jgi:serine/threonine protein phosphatase PrpC